jgi:hypothetical protein
MKHRLTRVLAAAALCGATTLTATAADDATPWDKVKSATHQQKEQAVTEARKLIAATDRQIDSLAAQAKKSGADAKAAHQQNMQELQAKKKAAGAELAKLEKASSNAWDATKEGFSNAYQDLKAAYNKAADSGK